MAVTYASIDPATGATVGVQRRLLAIFNDLSALTAAQKTAVWADFTASVIVDGVTAPRWSHDRSPDAGAIAAASIPAIDEGLTGATLTNARLKMVSIFVRANPLYLVNPSFDATINVPGFE